MNKKEYDRGYCDGYALKDAEHIRGKPEAEYRTVAYPTYVAGHKAGRLARDQKDAEEWVAKNIKKG